jgi:apolipoprotein D and lipocalin family protein
MTPGRALAAVLGLAALGACDLAAPPGAYRDADAPISASTRFDRADFAGRWIIAEGFGTGPGGTIDFAAAADEPRITVSGSGARGIAGSYREGVPGELIPLAGGAPLIVMWVDETRETAAIGTVSGTFGALIDRDGRVPPDKRLAARAIFDFYGWDVSRLEGTGT